MADSGTTVNAPNNNGTSGSTARRALLAMRDLRAELDALRDQKYTPVAIVGMGCRFPGAAGLAAFWEMLCQKRDGVAEVPGERWDAARFFHPDPKIPGKIAGRWGGFLDRLERFDASFFGISPREAPHVDPRQRVVLEIAWEALEDAGVPPQSLAGSATGVYMATLSNDYDLILSRNYRKFAASTGTGTANSIIANRLSYFLDLHGPSLTLDTACSGSLLTIELACRGLRSGEISLAIAGGVNINLLPKGDVFFSRAGAISPSGRCRTFDADADGIVRSEGAGVVVLKRVEDALEDGDRIYAVIRGGAMNHDGSSNGIMAPNGEAQKRVLREAYRKSAISPGSVQFIETHGTGTPLGDPIEVSALVDVMGHDRNGTPLVLGSLKSNVGHMEAAAGVASVIKTALALYHRTIPPNLHFRKWNPRMPELLFPLEVRTELGDWPVNDKPLLAAVSGFSFGGTNAHLVLEEAPRQTAKTTNRDENDQIFVLPLSAKSREALEASILAHREFLAAGCAGSSLLDVCYTAAIRRSHLPYRFAAVGSNAEEMTAQLAGSTAPGQSPRIEKVVFVFSGQGSHCKGMGEDLYRSEPVFREGLERCDRLFAERAGWSVIHQIRSGERLCDTEISQAAVFSVQVALAALWRSRGVVPDAVIGQSLGEVAAAHVAGALTLESAATVVHHRGRLMKRVAGQGKTAVIGLGAEAAVEAIAEWDGALHIAGISGPQTTVVSGTPPAVDAMVSTLEKRNVFARTLDGIDVAFHSPQMDPLLPEFVNALSEIDCRSVQTGMMSTVTGSWLNGAKPDAHYWGQNLRQPFQFAAALGGLINNGFDGFIEISPQPVLASPIRRVLAEKGASALVLASCRSGEPATETMLKSLAAIYGAGRNVNWAALFPNRGRVVSLPPYPWQRERYWLDQIPGGSATSELSGGHPFLGRALHSALPGGQHFWQQELDLSSLHYLSGHKVLGATVLPGAAYVEAAISAMLELQPAASSVELSGLRFLEPMPLSADKARKLQFAFSANANGRYDFRCAAREPSASEWIEHARGAASASGSVPTPVVFDQVRERCTDSIQNAEHYEAMARQGLEYGENFRAVQQLWRTGGEAVAELQLDTAASAEISDYAIHPILVDAAMQVVAAALEGSEHSIYSTESYVPEGIGAARWYANPGAQATCFAQLKAGKPGDPEIRANLRLLDSQRHACLEIDDLRLGNVGSGQRGARGKLRDWLYELSWKERPRTPSNISNSGSWTIFSGCGEEGEQLAQALRKRGCDCQVVPAPADDLVGYAETCGSGIVYMRGLDNAENPCSFLLKLVQALARSNRKELPALWIVTREAQSAGARMPVLTPAAQLWGFAKVLALEHPEIFGGIVDIGPPAATEAEQLADELLSPDAERQLALRNGTRFAPRLQLAEKHSNPSPVIFRPDASYLITGGLGGLGLAVARWMVEHGARHFVLIGRTALPHRSEWLSLPAEHPATPKLEAVRALERLGASVHIFVVDVADAKAMTNCLEAFHTEGWPGIRGVIHAAGLVDDQLMLRLDAETMAKVLRPKVAGARALHEATLGLNLDFFTLFSSVSSVLGQFGQAHYAAGNAFLDHLAHWRRAQGLPATTINWGPWAEIGLYARMDSTDKTGRSGVFPMLPRQALQAMELIHALSPVQAVVVSADWSRMPPSPLLAELSQKGGTARPSAEHEQAAAALLLNLFLAEPDERRRQLEVHLRDAAARVLRLDPAHLDPKEPLTSFGMDSIMVVELRNHIEQTMNLSVSMVDLFTGSITKLAEQIAGRLGDDMQLEKLLTQVENVSPEEIEALLSEGGHQQ